MASTRWRGGAAKATQVNTFTFAGTWEVGDLIRVSAGSKSWDYAVTSTVIATFLPLFVTAFEALAAADYPELAEVTASGATPVLTLTCNTAGVPFSITLTPLEAGGGAADAQTIEAAGIATTGTVATAATGPNHWDNALNWSGGAVPVNADVVTLDFSADQIKYGLAQSGVTLAALYVTSSFSGELGLPVTNQDGTSYPEYRSRYLAIGATLCVIGDGDGRGSGRVNIDFGTVQTAMTVRATGTGLESDTEAVQLKGTHASNALTVAGGEVAVAGFNGEVSTLLTLKESSGTVRLGPAVTLGTVTQTGGTLTLHGAATTVTRTAGSTTLRGSGAYATLRVDGGSVVYASSGTVTNLFVQSGGTMDYSQDTRARTVSNATVYPGAQILDPAGSVVWSAGIIEAGGADLNNWSLVAGPNRTVTVT